MDMKNIYQELTIEELRECFNRAFEKLDINDRITIRGICQDVTEEKRNMGKMSALELIAKTGIFLCGGKDDRIA
jgi:hypothetical protein